MTTFWRLPSSAALAVTKQSVREEAKDTHPIADAPRSMHHFALISLLPFSLKLEVWKIRRASKDGYAGSVCRGRDTNMLKSRQCRSGVMIVQRHTSHILRSFLCLAWHLVLLCRVRSLATCSQASEDQAKGTAQLSYLLCRSLRLGARL